MKLESLLAQLENIKVGAEVDKWEAELVTLAILELLVRYINNPKVEEKINDITF